MAIEQKTKSEKEIKGLVEEAYHSGADIHLVQNKDPNYEYRWLNTHKQNLETKKLRGWEVLSGESAKNVRTIANQIDSTHQVGDLVLARMPRGKYEAMMREKKELGDRHRKVAKEQFREEAKKAGLRPFDEDKERKG